MPFPRPNSDQLLKLRGQRGQALTEYAVIAAAVILSFAVLVIPLQQLLASNVEGTMNGLSSVRLLP